MGKLAITINREGIQTLSFLGSTQEERETGLSLYTILEEELRIIDKPVKAHFSGRVNTDTQGKTN